MADQVNVYSSTRNGINQLLNGSLQAIARVVDYADMASPLTPFREGAVQDPVLNSVVNIEEAKPASETIGGWKFWGTKGQAFHRRTRGAGAVRDGGHRGGVYVQVDFLLEGTIYIEQPLDPFEHLLSRVITFSAGFDAAEGAVDLQLQLVDGITVVAESDPFSSAFLTGYQRLKLEATLANDLSSLAVRIKAVGKQNTAFRFTDLSLSFGQQRLLDTDLAPDLGEIGRPGGALIMVVGDACPPGYRINCDLLNRIPFMTHGDILADDAQRDTGEGGVFIHDHGGRSGPAIGHTKVAYGGGTHLSGHRHTVEASDFTPPTFQILFCEKIGP